MYVKYLHNQKQNHSNFFRKGVLSCEKEKYLVSYIQRFGEFWSLFQSLHQDTVIHGLKLK
jgi:hypothetical protein